MCRKYKSNVWILLLSALGGLKNTMSFMQIAAKCEDRIEINPYSQFTI